MRMKGDQKMTRLEGWGFLCLIGCAVSVALSLSLLSGTWQAVGCGVGALLGILSRAGSMWRLSGVQPGVTLNRAMQPTAGHDSFLGL